MDSGTVLHEVWARARCLWRGRARAAAGGESGSQYGFASKPLNSHDSWKKEAWIPLPQALECFENGSYRVSRWFERSRPIGSEEGLAEAFSNAPGFAGVMPALGLTPSPGKANGQGEKSVLDKTAAVCVFDEMGRGGKGRTPNASCGAAKRLKRLKTAMGGYWKKLAWIWVWRHVRLGLAPLPLGFDATPAWVWRRSR